MKKFIKLPYLTFFSLFSLACQAAGIPPISGVANDGYTVSINCEDGPCTVEIWIENKDIKLTEKTWKGFYEEPCKYSEATDEHGEEIRTLSCDAKGKSPLSGTTYKGRQVKGSCERGDPDFRYVCVSGCSNSNRAPRKMTQDHWEC